MDYNMRESDKMSPIDNARVWQLETITEEDGAVGRDRDATHRYMAEAYYTHVAMKARAAATPARRWDGIKSKVEKSRDVGHGLADIINDL